MIIRAFLIDKSFVARNMLSRLLVKYGEDGNTIEIVGEAETVQGAVLMAEDLSPDLFIINPGTEDVRNIEASLKDIKHSKPDAKIIFCANPNARTSVISAWKRGADNFIIKPYSQGKVFGTIREVVRLNSLS